MSDAIRDFEIEAATRKRDELMGAQNEALDSMRALLSNDYTPNLEAPQLQGPNLVGGIGAALLGLSNPQFAVDFAEQAQRINAQNAQLQLQASLANQQQEGYYLRRKQQNETEFARMQRESGAIKGEYEEAVGGAQARDAARDREDAQKRRKRWSDQFRQGNEDQTNMRIAIGLDALRTGFMKVPTENGMMYESPDGERMPAADFLALPPEEQERFRLSKADREELKSDIRTNLFLYDEDHPYFRETMNRMEAVKEFDPPPPDADAAGEEPSKEATDRFPSLRVGTVFSPGNPVSGIVGIGELIGGGASSMVDAMENLFAPAEPFGPPNLDSPEEYIESVPALSSTKFQLFDTGRMTASFIAGARKTLNDQIDKTR
jgi:hypothetical protein